MSVKSLSIATLAMFFALSHAAVADAATITRDTNTGSTPNAVDFSPSYNNHPSQVSYRHNTAINVGEDTMFRETIPIVCERGQRVAGVGMTVRLMKLSKGGSKGDNDTLNFWVNGQNKYEFNIGAAATVGSPVVISFTLGALPPIGSGPNTFTAVSTTLPGNPPSLIADIRATQRVSFAVQDDTNINFATVDYTCENDPNAPPPSPFAVNPCCPPWNGALLGSSLQYVGSGSISSPYTLKFVPSAALIASLQAYLNYINSTNPSLTKLNIEFQLYDQGPPPLPAGHNGTAVGPVSGMTLTANSTAVLLHTNYNTNTPAIFTGAATPGTSTTPSSYPMQVGRKYMVHTGMWTDQGDFFDKALCANVDAFIQIVMRPGPRQRAPAPVLELRDSRGTLMRTIPLGGA
jgi:hypothetical protein